MQDAINETVDFYKEVFQETLKNPQAVDEFNRNIITTNKIINFLDDVLELFFEIVKGKRMNMFPNMQTMCLHQRFLKVDSIFDLGQDKMAQLENIIKKTFCLGFLYHCICMTFPTRVNIDSVNKEMLLNTWLHETLIANLKLRSYNSDANGQPEALFSLFYENKNDYNKIFKNNFSVGFFRRIKVRSFLNNIFYSGILLGLHFDLNTKE